MKKKKLFVLDTNVILHNSNCCYSFQEHNVAIPIEVVTELDHFKKGVDLINFNAREFMRFLDTLPSAKIFDGGAPLGKGLGKIRVIMSFDYHNNLKKYFSEEVVDHKIINTVYQLSKEEKYKNTSVIFVSKDVNLRIKAKSVGLIAEDYETDSATNVKSLYESVKTIQITDDIIADLYKNGEVENHLKKTLQDNEFLSLTSGKGNPALAILKNGKISLIKNETFSSFGIKAKNSEQILGLRVLLDPEIKLITIIGKAGTGKTILTLAAMIQQLEDGEYNQLFFTRSTVDLGNRDIGFLPGGVSDKISPYMKALSDNLSIIKGINKNESKVDKMVKSEKIILEPLPYIRGRSLVKTCFIIDEAQNLTPQEVKAIVTRAGEGTKIIFTGDITQIDHPYLDEKSNGLSYLVEKMRGQNFYAHVVLIKSERSRLAEVAGDLL